MEVRVDQMLPAISPMAPLPLPPAAQEASATFKTSLVLHGSAGEAAGRAPAGCVS